MEENDGAMQVPHCLGPPSYSPHEAHIVLTILLSQKHLVDPVMLLRSILEATEFIPQWKED